MMAEPLDAPLALARHPDTRATDLRKLWAEHLDRDDIARAVAAHVNCPKNLYTHFLRYFPDVIEANPAFQVEQGLKLLENMYGLRAQNLGSEELMSEFLHRRAHHYQYRYHMRDTRTEYRCVTAQYAPAEFVEAGLADAEVEVRVAMARRKQMPLAWWERLARDASAEVRLVVARSKHAPQAVVEALGADADSKVVAAAIRNSAKTASVPAPSILIEPDPAIRQAHAKTSTDVAILTALAQDGRKEVRRAVAINPATPDDVLAQLINDSDDAVRNGLARNPRLSAALMRQLAIDPIATVRQVLAKRVDCPVEIQRVLAQDGTITVLEELARGSRHVEVLDAIVTRLTGKDRRAYYHVWAHASWNPLLHTPAFAQLLLAHPDTGALIVNLPNAVPVDVLMPYFLANHFMDRFHIMRAVTPDRLLPLIDALPSPEDANDAFNALDNPLFTQPRPDTLAVRRQVLERLLQRFPKYRKATQARKLLKALNISAQEDPAP